MKKEILKQQQEELLQTLKIRFEKNMHRHDGIKWESVLIKLTTQADKLWSIYEMEKTGGEPDVVVFPEDVLLKNNNEFVFCDCAVETPIGRRSLCYDQAAWEARKENKPKNSALTMATLMGIEILTEEQYRQIQKFGPLDSKTSSWIKTPPEIRKLDGALFADFRYDHVFVYHNGAQSYYAARGFRGLIKV